MGTRLVAEVMEMAPATLTHREIWVLAVLAADAHDDTRETQTSMEDPEMLRRARVSRPQMYAVLKSLVTKGVLRRAAAGQRNRTAAYTLLGPGTATPAPAARRPAPPAPARPAPAKPTPARPTPDDPKFAEFWSAYPRKVAKGTARTAWAKAMKRGADPAQVIAAATRAAAHHRTAQTETRYIPHPATWLNGERYDDEPEAATAPPTTPTTRYADPSEKGIF
ncbi:hypothetical protein ACFWGL_17010 [Streptomyces sp. NPDC060286]|uniref:hypothetical protein n=1 Tax=unclassified Streptomyces TaxID=2593676 RepID=UPI0035DE169C